MARDGASSAPQPGVIVTRHEQQASPWVTVVAKTVRWPDGRQDVYHCLGQADYVSVLALTSDGQIPIVRQYRPALERVTIELPGGLAERDEPAIVTAARELEEECGLVPALPLEPLIVLDPDSGRLENRMQCFFAPVVHAVEHWRPEPGIAPSLMSVAELSAAVASGTFCHAPHLAMIAAAAARGLVRLAPP